MYALSTDVMAITLTLKVTVKQACSSADISEKVLDRDIVTSIIDRNFVYLVTVHEHVVCKVYLTYIL